MVRSYTNTADFVLPGTYQIWLEAEDHMGNTTIAGPYTLVTTPRPSNIWLPVVFNGSGLIANQEE